MTTTRKAMPRPRDCRENRSCSSTRELSSQAHAPSMTTRIARPRNRYDGRVRMCFNQVLLRGSRPRCLDRQAKRWLRNRSSGRERSCHTLIVPGSPPGCTHRCCSQLEKCRSRPLAIKRSATRASPLRDPGRVNNALSSALCSAARPVPTKVVEQTAEKAAARRRRCLRRCCVRVRLGGLGAKRCVGTWGGSQGDLRKCEQRPVVSALLNLFVACNPARPRPGDRNGLVGSRELGTAVPNAGACRPGSPCPPRSSRCGLGCGGWLLHEIERRGRPRRLPRRCRIAPAGRGLLERRTTARKSGKPRLRPGLACWLHVLGICVPEHSDRCSTFVRGTPFRRLASLGSGNPSQWETAASRAGDTRSIFPCKPCRPGLPDRTVGVCRLIGASGNSPDCWAFASSGIPTISVRTARTSPRPRLFDFVLILASSCRVDLVRLRDPGTEAVPLL